MRNKREIAPFMARQNEIHTRRSERLWAFLLKRTRAIVTLGIPIKPRSPRMPRSTLGNWIFVQFHLSYTFKNRELQNWAEKKGIHTLRAYQRELRGLWKVVFFLVYVGEREEVFRTNSFCCPLKLGPRFLFYFFIQILFIFFKFELKFLIFFNWISSLF